MLPQVGEAGSRLPDYLHLSVNQKLIAAYVLGKFSNFGNFIFYINKVHYEYKHLNNIRKREFHSKKKGSAVKLNHNELVKKNK